MNNEVKIGTFVKSKYAAPWIGVIVGIKEDEGSLPLIVCLVVRTRDGKTPRKRILHHIYSGYMAEDVEPFPIDHINKDWFDISTSPRYSKWLKNFRT